MLKKLKPPAYRVELSDTKKFFTKSELGVAACICLGMCDKKISEYLGVAISTVGQRTETIYRKLNLTNEPINQRCAVLGILAAYGIAKFIPMDDQQ